MLNSDLKKRFHVNETATSLNLKKLSESIGHRTHLISFFIKYLTFSVRGTSTNFIKLYKTPNVL